MDYLVEDNSMDDFFLSSKMDGTHGRTTFEDDPGQQLLRRAAHGNWHNGGGSWEQNATVGNVPTIISSRDSDFVGNMIFQASCLEKRVCNTNRQDDFARFSGNELR